MSGKSLADCVADDTETYFRVLHVDLLRAVGKRVPGLTSRHFRLQKSGRSSFFGVVWCADGETFPAYYSESGFDAAVKFLLRKASQC